ncbi:DUF1287 domain-containing protein [Marinimicrobium sp. ABcell2]|uniref:DUF1287 domain-containing protein n=1 Tax=Marinimicrobium sp. ABcell2 TaxID=3069751 RepID=UPI0027B475AB|nr:DUF1287 domain-containing protein [Marinimicrobium sp. ABcell2]MDQ2077810.1 DUF1287 domain-containing protein [Marinimicrobium sp. ABcell2]
MKAPLLLTLLLLAVNVAAFQDDLVQAAHLQTQQNVRYDPSYFSIDYPNGDVPADIGVCTDVVIRAYRALGEDLQLRVHEDMAANFDDYPSRRIWGLQRPDTNIDHRRVPNLRRYFERQGASLPVSNNPDNYQAGDLVTWMLPGNLPHIGIVVDELDPATGAPLIVHNMGRGPELENILFAYPIDGHYRYAPQTHAD